MLRFESFRWEIKKTVDLWRYWLYSAFIRLQQKHAQTSFKFLWEPASTLFMASVLCAVWSQVLDITNPREYFLYLVSGLLIWALLSDLTRQGVASLRKNSRNMTIRPLPLCTYVAEDIAFGSMGFVISLPVIYFLVIVLGGGSLAGFAWFLIGILLILIAAFGFSLSVGIAAFYLGDVQQLVYAVMRLGFLVTPVIWKPERLGDYANWIWVNPFYGFLDICRSGMLGEAIDLRSLIVAGSIAAVLLVAGLTSLYFYNDGIRKRAFQY